MAGSHQDERHADQLPTQMIGRQGSMSWTERGGHLWLHPIFRNARRMFKNGWVTQTTTPLQLTSGKCDLGARGFVPVLGMAFPTQRERWDLFADLLRSAPMLEKPGSPLTRSNASERIQKLKRRRVFGMGFFRKFHYKSKS